MRLAGTDLPRGSHVLLPCARLPGLCAGPSSPTHPLAHTWSPRARKAPPKHRNTLLYFPAGLQCGEGTHQAGTLNAPTQYMAQKKFPRTSCVIKPSFWWLPLINNNHR